MRALAACLPSLLASMAPGHAQRNDGNPDICHEIARTWCSNCHAVEPMTKDRSTVVAPSFSAVAHVPPTTAASIHAFLQTSHGQMPDFKLSRDDIDNRRLRAPRSAWRRPHSQAHERMVGFTARQLLDNDLAEGRYQVRGAPVAIGDMEVPIFAVGTLTDHVAPWPSVYKIHLLTDAEVPFVLTSGGHNAGIESQPGHRGRSMRRRGTISGRPEPRA